MIGRIIRVVQLILAISIVFGTSIAFAQTTQDSNLCGGDALSNLFCEQSLSSMLNQIFQLAIALGGILAMLRIAYAGWLYMGREDMWSSKTHAKEVFRDAIIGLLLLLAIWLILNQINPCILSLQILQPPGSSCNPTSYHPGT